MTREVINAPRIAKRAAVLVAIAGDARLFVPPAQRAGLDASFADTAEQALGLLLAAPLPLAVLWWRNANVVIAASYLGALYSPLVAAAALSSAIEYLIAVIVWVAGGLRGSAPRPGPTLRRED